MALYTVDKAGKTVKEDSDDVAYQVNDEEANHEAFVQRLKDEAAGVKPTGTLSVATAPPNTNTAKAPAKS